MKKIFVILTSLALATLVAPQFLHAEKMKDMHKRIIENADLENGKSIYEHGKRHNGPRIAFNGGPHWMRSQSAGCQTCHGPQGLGGKTPDFCTVETPPITCKYLRGNGYSLASRKNGEHPAYDEHALKKALKTGVKPNGIEMDYCMPRWRFINKDFFDLLGYLHTLEAH